MTLIPRFRCNVCGQLALGKYCQKCHIEEKIAQANGDLIFPPDGDDREKDDPSIFHIRYRAAQIRLSRKIPEGYKCWRAVPRLVRIIPDPMIDD